MDSVKWPHSVAGEFQTQFSALPPEVFDRLIMHVDSAVSRSEKVSLLTILFNMGHDDLNYTVTLHVNYARQNDDRVITQFEGTIYTVPLP